MAEDSSLDSRSKEKSQKRKEKNESDLVSPPRIDFTGLPEEPTESPLKPQTQSHDANPESEEKKKKDQDAEDTNQYDLSQVEVIDVNAEDCIPDERTLLRYKIGKTVWETYGPNLEIFDGTADFLLYITGKLTEDTTKPILASKAKESTKFVDHFGSFTIVSMYYMRALAYSQLFQALTERNIMKSSSGCHFNGRTLTYKAHFCLCHIAQSADGRTNTRKILGAEWSKILKFFRDNFNQVIREERNSLENSFDQGNILYIIAFNAAGDYHHTIAVIMYVTCAEGSYINWFAVSQEAYDTQRFGKYANKQPFCNMGLGSFLLQMVQLQAVAQGYSPNLYLQANMSTIAFEYYQHRGFVLAESNDPKLMPETLWNWSQQAKDEKEKNPYVYFVTDKELINDAKSRNEDPDAPEVQAKFMHLLKLKGLLKMTGNSGDVKKVYLEEHCLPKCSENTPFL